jgi:hypothetical protein
MAEDSNLPQWLVEAVIKEVGEVGREELEKVLSTPIAHPQGRKAKSGPLTPQDLRHIKAWFERWNKVRVCCFRRE